MSYIWDLAQAELEIERLRKLREIDKADTLNWMNEMEARVEHLKAALREVDALAVRHEAGAIGKAQKIARAALARREERK